MKSLIYSLFLLSAIVSVSCSGDDDNDFLTISEFLEQQTLNPQITSSGLHYIINNPGEESKPTIFSNVTVNYDGYFLGGESFEVVDDINFPLSNVILGWQEGIQLIGAGGSITLLIPARLAYGDRGARSIPPNTDIGFDIELISFN